MNGECKWHAFCIPVKFVLLYSSFFTCSDTVYSRIRSMGMQTLSKSDIFFSLCCTCLLSHNPSERLIFIIVRDVPLPQAILLISILLLHLVSILLEHEPHGRSTKLSSCPVIEFQLITNGCIYYISKTELWIAYLVLIISETCECLVNYSNVLLTDVKSVAIGFLMVKACEQCTCSYYRQCDPLSDL